ncbi:MAG TPA: choice-of-anchor tandem repeat GloVer-containing protein [Terriglobales bacterium]
MSRPKIADIEIKNERGLRWFVLAGVLFLTSVVPLRAQSYNDLWDFSCPTNNLCNPVNFGQFVQGRDGTLYGTVLNGGEQNLGPGGLFNLNQFVNSFHGSNYSVSGFSAGLTLASDGYFYGTTLSGGTFGYGTVFRADTSLNLTILHSFNGTDGVTPLTPPVQGPDGNLYGVTSSGTTYRITLPAGTFKQLTKNIPNNYPTTQYATLAPLYLASDGNLYGISAAGGKSGNGTVFQMTTTGAISVVYNFTGGTDGATPYGPLTQGGGADTNLYGTTSGGGSNGCGAIFKLTLKGAFTPLYSFDACSSGFNDDGAAPYPGLLAVNGQLYGANTDGGANGEGTIYQVTTTGTFTKLFDLGSAVADGTYPYATLMLGTDGTIYGTTFNGGAGNGGVLFSVVLPTPVLILRVEGPIFVRPGVPVQFLGIHLTQAFEVTFAREQAEFSPQADTFMTVQVPSDAVDGVVAVTLDTGLQYQTQSAIHVLPIITDLDPISGAPGTQVVITGGGFAGAKKVSFGGVKATTFSVQDPMHILTTVPAAAKTGKVTVTTPNGTVKSKQTFTVN